MRNKQGKIVKANAGITLIALIITVIVMLILAGVAINMIIGDNGIFKKSDEGAKIYKNAANNEATSLNSMDKEMADLMEQLENSEDPTRIVDIVRKVYVESLKTRVVGGETYWVLTADGKIRVGESFEQNVFDKLEMGPEVQVEGLPNGNIAHIATNGNTAIVLDKTGKVYTFGQNNQGQLGNGTTEDSDVPICISNTGELQGKVIKEISIANYGKIMAIDKEGKLYSWGDDNTTPVCISNEITGLQDKVIKEILYRYDYDDFIVKDNAGKIYRFYNNDIIDLDTAINEENIEILKGKDIIDFKGSTFLDRDGKVYTMGEDTVVCINDNMPILQGKKIVEIKMLNGIILLYDQEGKVYAFKNDDIICLNDDNNSGIYNKKVDKIITGYIRYGEFCACIIGNDIYILRVHYPA